MEKVQKKISIVILILVILLAVFFSAIRFITDFMWFQEMGYVDVFFKQLVTQLTVGIPTFLVVTGLVVLYLNRLRKSYFKKIASSEDTNLKKLKKITLVFAAIFGIFTTATTVTELWFDILKFANSTDFNIADPLFHMDISFYIFRLEFLSQLNEILIGVIVGFVVLTILYYIVLMTVRTPDVFKEEPAQGSETGEQQTEEGERYGGNANPFEHGSAGGNDPFGKFAEAFFGKKAAPRPVKPKKQFDDNNFKQLMSIASGKIGLLGFIFFIMLAINFFLRQFDLLHVHTGAVYGAGFTDVNITLWMYRILCVLSVLSAILFVVHMKKKNYKKLLTVPVIMILVGVIGSGAG